MPARSQFIGAAGQHYVAYCLGIREIHAAITLGNVPSVDIVVAEPNGSASLSIQVKTSRWAHRPKRYGKEVCEWDVGPSAVERCSESLWYAFVDLRESSERTWSPRVFIVPSVWVGKFVQAGWSRKMYRLPAEAWPQCLERWDRFSRYFDQDPETMDWCRSAPGEVRD
ncbi:hypothetical protein KJZ99_08085 [bacterium]|nr:hypothetical protein [bacterium]